MARPSWLLVLACSLSASVALADEAGSPASPAPDEGDDAATTSTAPSGPSPTVSAPSVTAPPAAGSDPASAELVVEETPAPIGPRLPSEPSTPPGAQSTTPPTTTPGPLPPPDEASTEWPTEWMHYGTQTATSCACCGCPGAFSMLAIPISLIVFWIPYVGLISSLVVLALPSCLGCGGFIIAPLVGSGLGVLWPEWLGTTRGPMAWPVLSSYATEAFSLSVISVGVIVLAGFSTVFAFSTLNPAFSFSNPTSGEPVFQNWENWNYSSLGIGAVAGFALVLGGVIMAVVTPALASVLSYGALSDEKEPDDTGFRFPGMFSGNGITPEEREAARLDQDQEDLERQEKLRIQDKKQEEWKRKQREREREQEKKKGPKPGEPLPVSLPIGY